MIGLHGDVIEDYYKMNYFLTQKRSFDTTSLEMMIPFEREILISQIAREMREKKSKTQQKKFQKRM